MNSKWPSHRSDLSVSKFNAELVLPNRHLFLTKRTLNFEELNVWFRVRSARDSTE